MNTHTQGLRDLLDDSDAPAGADDILGSPRHELNPRGKRPKLKEKVDRRQALTFEDFEAREAARGRR